MEEKTESEKTEMKVIAVTNGIKKQMHLKFHCDLTHYFTIMGYYLIIFTLLFWPRFCYEGMDAFGLNLVWFGLAYLLFLLPCI